MPLVWRRLLRRSGLPLPEVVITSDPDEAGAFRRRLAAEGVGGAAYAPLTGTASYLLADDEAWDRLSAVQRRVPVCLVEPHGEPMLACIVGREVVWNGPVSIEAEALEPLLRRFAAAAQLSFVEIAIAPVRGRLAVVLVNPYPRLEHFAQTAQAYILDALCDLLAPEPADVPTVTEVPA